MRTCLVNAAMFFLLGVPSVADAQQFEGENLLVSVPEGWVAVTGARKGTMYLSEFVPKGQTADNWRQMITIQVFHGMGHVDPKTFVDGMTAGAREQVENDAFAVTPLDMPGDPGYPSFGVLWASGRVRSTGQGEITAIRAIQGKDSLYVVQKAWRQAAFSSAEQLTVSPEEIRKGVDFLSEAKVVDTRK